MPSSPFAPLGFKVLIFSGVCVSISLIWKHKKCSSKKASSGQSTTVEKLPNEVLSEIFTRLLAKQLSQMRCVSKSWNALLSDSAFIKSHLHRSIQNNDEVLLFTSFTFSFNTGPSSPFRTRLSRSPNVELTSFIKLPVIRQGKYGWGIVIGSVNGLICFYYTSSNDHIILHIWNPSLSALLSLPPCPLRSFHRIELGFGYDPNSDDYKIVKLTPDMEPQCEVYSMRKGFWNLITQRFPSRLTICRGENQVYVDGHVHWLCRSDLEGNPQMIAGFHLDVETFYEIPLPDAVYKCLNRLGVLGGKLCLMSKDRYGGEWEVWVMNEYGVAESWVKRHVFSQFRGDIVPYGFTSHGNFLFQFDRYKDGTGLYLHFGLYDPVAANIKTFKIKSNSSESRVVEYADSLVWVAPPGHKSDKVKRKWKTSLLKLLPFMLVNCIQIIFC